MKTIITTAVAVMAVAAVVPGVLAQQPPTNEQHMMEHHHQQMMQDSQSDAATPTMPGQDAFGAIQEIVRMLEADPNTDWSKVNLEALRQHLIDMNQVTLNAEVVSKPVDDGIVVIVTGAGRTAKAIQRMVPAHAQEIENSHLNGWSAKTEPLADGVVLTVTSSDPQQAKRLRGLGFIGIMVSGSHHQPHHLGMAKGEFVHSQ